MLLAELVLARTQGQRSEIAARLMNAIPFVLQTTIGKEEIL